MQPTKDLLLNKKKGRGYISYTTQSKDQAPVPGKRFTAIGVPGATVPPQVFAQDKNYLTEAELEVAQTGSNGEEGLSAVEPTKEEYRKIAETRPGAVEVPTFTGQIIPSEKKSPAQPANTPTTDIPQREHQTANGGVMPTRSASGEVIQQTNTPSAEQPTGTPKPRVPGADIKQPSKYAIRQQSRDLADKVMGLEDINRILNQASPQKTAEEIEADERKEKRDNLLAKIGDGLSSFHEAYSYMRGVKPMTNGTSLTGRMRERRERMDRERQAMDAKRISMAMNIAKLKQQQRAAESLADYRQGLNEKWKNENLIAQQKAAAQEEANKERARLAREKEENRKEEAAKKQEDYNKNQAANRAAANARNKYNQSQQNARQREREANKDRRAKEKSGTKKTLPGKTKTKKKLPK